MTEKYYCEDYDEYAFNTENNPYRIYDLSKSNKTKEDFYDNEKECYDIAAFEEYLLDNDCMLTSDQVKDRLIKQEEKIKQLEKENKDFDDAINEISNILVEAYEQGVSNPYLKRIGKVKLYDR